MNAPARLNNRFLASGLFEGRSNTPLTETQLRTLAPSIFASGKHTSRSDKFAYIPTWNVVQALVAEGFAPVAAKQGRSRVAGKADYTKHMIRFQHPDMAYKSGVKPEVIVVNAHDGTAAYRVMAGAFRPICYNGLIAADDFIDEVRVGHSGHVADKVIEGTWKVVEETKKITQVVPELMALPLNQDEAHAFAEAAHSLRFEEGSVAGREVDAGRLLKVHRPEDAGTDLWSTFNRVQENTLRGGLVYTAETKQENGSVLRRMLATRPVKAIDQDTALNKALWALTMKMAELKLG